ncbi:HNH endonuclease [Echinicola sp. CAU 1574]|uniref:HNH endonuclease n=1 Tax=Echinicola arenosa TaxID=2774144 RepID=A0ABR9AKF1_9BACT|nr:HNH endonuclease [Echinicola arenosa]MBD8489190.1 HNH endonuclease [Echinicola arenosa]
MDDNLESKFNDKAFEIYEAAKKYCGYNATRFLQKIRKDGGLKAAKSWLNPKAMNKPPTKGFITLVNEGRLDISLEALVLREPWRELFTSEELAVASQRLREYGYENTELFTHSSDKNIPEELTENSIYAEGSSKRILVNSYERDSSARKSCLKHHGYSCIVCEFNFEDHYGSYFKDFIHVHHLRPIASIGKEYQLDPVRDLIPVCPNCHAIMHRRNPPYTVHEVKKMIKSKKKKNQNPPNRK